MDFPVTLFTIGHSNHPMDKFIHLLESNGIMTLVDVRSAPYSRYNSQFNKGELQHKLAERDIQYIYAGKYLGGRPNDPACYKSRKLPDSDADFLHEVDYPEVMKRSWFIQGVQRLLEIADEQITAIMCSEEDPADCHRHHLIFRYLQTAYPNVQVTHIRGDGSMYGAKSIRTSVDTPPAEQLSLF